MDFGYDEKESDRDGDSDSSIAYTRDLFSAKGFENVQACKQYMESHHGFSFKRIKDMLGKEWDM